MSIELFAHVVLDIARHADQDPALQEEKETTDYTRAQHLGRGDREIWPVNLRRVLVNCMPDDKWNEKADSNTAENARDTEDQLNFVFPKIVRKLL
jgi:hypothetical protein